MIGIGVIGYGYWGPNLVRNFMQVPGARVVAVSDMRTDRLALVQRQYPSIRTTTNFREIIHHVQVDAVVIATPVTTHYELADIALRAGKHVLVEKPLSATSGQGLNLIEEALRRNRVLMVDHTFVYTGAVRKAQELVANNGLGAIYYYDSVRVNLGLFQHDVNVIWDLAVHDLAIMDYVLPLRPQAVSATGMSHVSGKPENIAYLTLFFDSNLIAHIHVNWLAPVKIRRTLIGGSQKMVVYDDLEPSEKLKVYDKGITVNNGPETLYRMLIGYRTGDMWAPQIDITEALQFEAQHFVECVEKGQQPVTDGEAGLRVVRILEAASQSMMQRGQLVKINAGRLAA
jgi:predicted dehydrogenase